MAPDNHIQRPINDDTATAIDPAHYTVRTLRTHAAAVLANHANKRSWDRRRLERRNEPRILVYDAEQLIERRRMRDRRLQAQHHDGAQRNVLPAHAHMHGLR